MSTNESSGLGWLGSLVAAHLAICLVHGMAHGTAQVPVSPAANLFVFVVILGGPPAGLLLAWKQRRAGGWVIAATMAASFVFGVLNHFVFDSPDHVAHVASQWQPLFAATAALLGVSEALGTGAGLRLARKAGA